MSIVTWIRGTSIRKEWAAQGSGEGMENSPPIPRPHVGGLYSTPDVQSLWSYD
ncbi:hypothetical protein Acr_02g0006950 [Actinidia rufa]|uniref:Uncharacterized protein n=1 Tax=Actinidia rufa TaxID=165716 RepID=A0A7J0E7V8_9ERIC|nr:hypothetical protein Acr_02g0006950 [Actinidia rufa]